ncbi:MAG: helix-turn-helix domain-containing protein, partial [Pirellulales bacterium]
MTQTVEAAPDRLNEVRRQLAQFHLQQFGVQTLAQYSAYFAAGLEDKPDDSGTYALHTLGEDETIARLASGVKRFKLPDEFNHIRILQQIPAVPQFAYAAAASDGLAGIFENRRQYPQAAEYWRKAIKQFGPGNDNYRQKRLEQIEGNVGRFDGHGVQPAGKGASVEFRFRNGKQVHFEAHEIHVAKLLDDLKAYLKSNPQQLDGNKLNLHDLGYRLVTQQQKQYVGQRVAEWDLTLEPREKHFDKRVTVATPLQKAGAYLLTAKMAGGNTCQAIVWVADTVIAKKALDKKTYYFVADAVTGQPVAKANVELFGYRQQHVGGNRFQVQTTNFAEFTDADGQLITDIKDANGNYQWIITARDGKGRFAYLGLERVMHEKARLGILTSLVGHAAGLLFTDLKELCALTDGNLNRHLKVLQDAGLVEVLKGF